MDDLLFIGILIAACMMVVFLYLFTIMRLSIIIQGLIDKDDPTSHIYWVYKNRFLINITDWQPFISAILLWNYQKLAKDVTNHLDLSGDKKIVLQHACAFGNVSERIARECASHGARLTISDIIENQLIHSKRKLDRKDLASTVSFAQCDATALPYPDGSFDRVISFFLFHELPLEKKRKALAESMRVLKPGGKIIGAEFHRPDSLLLRVSGTLFFFIFERYAREMWDMFDIEKEIRALATDPNEWTFSKRPVFSGNYFSFEAQKAPDPAV